MITPGLYIRKEKKYLEEQLARGEHGLSPVSGKSPRTHDGSHPRGDVTLCLRELGEGWCHLEMSGDGRGTSRIMDFLTGHESIGELLVWDYDGVRQEFGYSLFRKGRMEEQLAVRGPILDNVSFFSNMRKVETEQLVDGLGFSLRYIESLGICGRDAAGDRGEETVLDLFLPPPRPLWKRLLGSLSGEE